MARALLRRSIAFTSMVNSPVRSMLYNFCYRASSSITGKENGAKHPKMDYDRGANSDASANNFSRVNLSPLLSPGITHLEDFEIELVDPDTWRVSTGLAQSWRETDRAKEEILSSTETVDEPVNYSSSVADEADFDEIEDMRIRGNLFYKLDRDSREFEEYNLSFHRKKTSKNTTKERKKENQNKEKSNHKSASENGKLPNLLKGKQYTLPLVEKDGSSEGKKLRTPTFNQLTGPYHEPFCLDIFISKGSVRACIVHRATSKVVAVAHSISKDMKFDLGSTKNATTCAAVGKILAQRALADDIHDVIYTPRKGERLEGFLRFFLGILGRI
ncbi:uncharacterized protein LOC122092000 isoform X2 [Macadamia integrifolia]|uniref:uncharacterized protein LOC122092000 isoform X2 n=1 Tax=Macadamia integrifolia TaxID=60698 RepID=UPI001C4EE845|nr:uncharacterized protein LOC122092000 isoform X2 [Macadamia integrifolia]